MLFLYRLLLVLWQWLLVLLEDVEMHDRGDGRASCMRRNLIKVSLALGGLICYCLLRIGCISQLRCSLMTNLKLSCSNTIEFVLHRPLSLEISREESAVAAYITPQRWYSFIEYETRGRSPIHSNRKEGNCALRKHFQLF